MRRVSKFRWVIGTGVLLVPGAASAAAPRSTDFTTDWVGVVALGVFAAGYPLVIAEEATRLRKSKPVVVAAGLLWTLIAAVFAGLGRSSEVTEAFRHVLLEYAELLLFLLVAMTYVNALEERLVFDALRAWLVRAGLGYRALFWAT